MASATLAQDEVWDDSALVRSWDEAVKEYKVRSYCTRLLADHVLTRHAEISQYRGAR